MRNATWLNRFLPSNSPLSTMRVITSSSWSLMQQQGDSSTDPIVTSATTTTANTSAATSADTTSPTKKSGSELGVLSTPTKTSVTVSTSTTSVAAVSGISNSATRPVGTESVVSPRTPLTNRSARASSPLSDNTWTDVGAERTTTSSNEVEGIQTNTSTGTSSANLGIDRKKTDTKSEVPANAPVDHTGSVHIDSTLDASSNIGAPNQFIKPLSAVLRLGRQNASTDHSAILFNVDIKSGAIGVGTTNAHWYQLGVDKIVSCPWLCTDSFTSHPDAPYPIVTGHVIPGIQEAMDVVTKAHMSMMKDVPIVGWDVAFTDQGIYLLEVNLSCNFFKGRFDVPEYITFVDKYFTMLSSVESATH